MLWFKKIICKIKGHNYVPLFDMNGKYLYDVCTRCQKKRTRIKVIDGGLR